MSVFTLAISCLTMPNLPWFVVLPFQVPMQYYSLLHQTLLSPPDTPTGKCHFCFGPVSSFFLVLFLCSSPVAYWIPSQLKGLIFLCLTFLFFLYMCGCWQFSRVSLFVTPRTIVCQAPLTIGFPRQAYWSGLVAISFSMDSSWPGIKPRSPSLQAVSLPSELYILYIYHHIFISRKCG